MQAFQNLLNLHILFCPPRNSEAEDPPVTLLSLTLDEEVQLRCAALVQAEIERFAEDVAEHDETADRSDEEGASGDDDAAPKKGTSKRNKKALNGTAEVPAGTSIHPAFVFGRGQ
jgi:cohesin complex subunit SA-1/2